MRARLLALLTLLLLLTASLAAADDRREEEDSGEGSDDEGSDGSGHDDAPEPCEDEEDGNSTANGTEEDGDDCGDDRPGRGGHGPGGARVPPPCEGNESDDCRLGQGLRERLRDRWVDFEVLDGAALANYTVSGRLILERLSWTDAGELQMDRNGSRLLVTDGNGTLTLHNNPTGLIRFNGTGSFDLAFPAGVTLSDGDNFTVVDVNGTEVRVNYDNGTWDNSTLEVSGFWSLHVPVRGAAAEVAQEVHEERIEQAIEDRRIGAEIRLERRGGGDASTLAASDDDGVEILAYDAVDVQVEMPADVASEESPIRIEVSSELPEGRTIVLNVDPELLASADPEDLRLAYFDVNEDGTETEVVFRMASDLNDVLDATDDEGQPEYWVVSDQNGLQVLVSVPHWSTHAITVSSVVEALTQPSVVVGIVAGVAGSVAAAVLMVWPRRRQQQF